MLLWDIDYFEVKALDEQQIEEGLPSPGFVFLKAYARSLLVP